MARMNCTCEGYCSFVIVEVKVYFENCSKNISYLKKNFLRKNSYSLKKSLKSKVRITYPHPVFDFILPILELNF